MSDRQLLTGWGRTAPTAATVRPVHAEEVADLVRAAGERGVLARGLGRSYGDAAQNAGGAVLLLPADGGVKVDVATGEATVDAGVSFARLISVVLPLGFFPPVTPGTAHVTMGGAVASDVHGKNHHGEGSFGHHLTWIRLVDGTGAERLLTPVETPEEFWATLGGMGLTGVVLSVGLRLKRVDSAHIEVELERLPDLDHALIRMGEADSSTYSVAWIDLLATGRHLGRSVLMRGEHAAADDLPPGLAREPLQPPRGRHLGVPFAPPVSLVTKASVRVFNELYFRRAPRRPVRMLESYGSFFHPLDAVDGWNRLYGRRGFTQYQFVVPLHAADALRHVISRLASSGHSSFLAVLKRMGPGDPGLLSFPEPGWTLALDLPVRPGVGPLLTELDAVVTSAGGRLYLAKDSRMTPETLAAMYPRAEEFRAARKRMDPHSVFRSDLARRLEL